MFLPKKYSKESIVDILEGFSSVGISFLPVHPYAMTTSDIDYILRNPSRQDLKEIIPDELGERDGFKGYPYISYMYIHLPGSDIGNGRIAMFEEEYEFIGYRYMHGQ